MKPFGVAEESNLIPVIGSFEAVTESDHETGKGGAQTAPLLRCQDGKDLGMILVSNTRSNGNKYLEDVNRTAQLLEEYKD